MEGLAREALPPGWVVARLGDIIEPTETVNPAIEFRGRESFAYVSLSAVEPGRILPTEKIPPADAPSRARQRIRTGDTLFSCVRVYLEKSVRVPESLDGEVCSTAFAVLRPRPGVDPEYVYWLTRWPAFLRAAEAHQRGNSPPAVQEADLRSLTVPLAPSAEQTRIVAAVRALFEEVEAGEAALARAREGLAQFRASLLHAACTGALSADWRNANPTNETGEEVIRASLQRAGALAQDGASRAGSSVMPDALPELPSSWRWAKLWQLCHVTGGITVDAKRNGDDLVDIPYLRVANVQRGRLDLETVKTLRSRPSTWWKKLLGLRWPRFRRPWVEVAGFRWLGAG